jgi:hypothetical protein
MAESRIAQLGLNDFLSTFAIDRSQKALKPSGMFIAPQCTVADVNFHFKTYDSIQRFTIPNTQRQVGGRATRLSFGGIDTYQQLVPNALDLPIPAIQGLSKEALSYQMQEGMGIIADTSALALEYQQISTAIAGAATNFTLDWTASSAGVSTNDPINDPTNGLDQAIRTVMLAAPGTEVRILFGVDAMLDFRRNTNVTKKFVVGASDGSNVGLVSPRITDVGDLLFNNPKVQISNMVRNAQPLGTIAVNSGSTPGMSASLSFLLGHTVIVFASNATPNRMDPSFMKTFTPIDGFFKPGTYMSEDQRDEIAKIDWIVLPLVTNAQAAVVITTN